MADSVLLVDDDAALSQAVAQYLRHAGYDVVTTPDAASGWAPDSGGSRTPCGPPPANTNPATCTFTPNESGTLQIQADVNGVVLTTSVHIRLLCALTGDPLLDSLPLLDALKAAEDSSGDYNVEGNQASRREWYAQLHCDATGDCSYQLDMGNSPCRATPPIFDTTNLVADGHTHPFWPVERATPPGTGWVFRNPSTDSIPDICKDSKDMGSTVGNAPRPSPADFEHASDYNIPPKVVREYVLDPKNIYAIPGGDMPLADRAKNTRSIPRVQGSCRII